MIYKILEEKIIKAIAVFPGKPNSVHLEELSRPNITDIPNNRGVLIKVLRVGVCGTDKEIIAAEYGIAPEGYNFLVLGHENFGIVEEVGKNVSEFKPGDYVVATVRRPGNSIYDQIGTYDMTLDEIYYERGISRRHGYFTEYYVEDPEYILNVPSGLKEIGVLMEPTSIVEKGIEQAYEIQQRLRIWRPKKAAVLGASTVGLLAAMVLRLKGIEVYVFARTEPPYLNSRLVEEIGGTYISTRKMTLSDASKQFGSFDIIFEATGYAPIVFEAMEVLGKNGVLILTSVTGGDHKIEIPADKINMGLVLGNKVIVGTVNANREYFIRAVQDHSQAMLQFPEWTKKLLTHKVDSLENYEELFKDGHKEAIKVYCEISPLS